ncbi:hypothetical protein BGW36DRAFT_307848 [Talaromyces proteolyticus]|uniref:Uncharacterized protein n=1 Tax=Talaromyces proteolyticus TaxID=1131652 RepID=A0AAD4PUU3_9EURO|nr:uncharacterized protein BGW36DRAFT_307848 [Talaromyces proteolyticus]KAH8689831.1 hypothetical protein BGW36DRAFT_307848 [Talaromyces proteolyticus]
MCSATQHITMISIINPRITPSTRHSLWYPFFSSYKRVVFLSAPCQLSTIFFSLMNLNYSPASSLLWLAAICFVFAHAYPLRVGLEHFNLTAEDWQRKIHEEGYRFLKGFVNVNGRRLLLVDFPGWLCVFAAVVVHLRS